MSRKSTAPVAAVAAPVATATPLTTAQVRRNRKDVKASAEAEQVAELKRQVSEQAVIDVAAGRKSAKQAVAEVKATKRTRKAEPIPTDAEAIENGLEAERRDRKGEAKASRKEKAAKPVKAAKGEKAVPPSKSPERKKARRIIRRCLQLSLIASDEAEDAETHELAQAELTRLEGALDAALAIQAAAHAAK